MNSRRVPFSVSLTRRTPLRIACLCAALTPLALVAAQLVPDPPPAPVDAPPPAAQRTVLEKVRAAYLSQATTERLRISVRQGDRPPRRSLLLVRLEPALDSRSMRRAVLRAGRLLIEAIPGRVSVRLDAADSPLFIAETAAADVAGTLAEALPPLPLAPLDLTSASFPPTSLTPYGASVRFQTPDLMQKTGQAIITGTINGGTFKLTADAATGRLRRLEIQFGDPSRIEQLRTITIEHAASSADLSNIDFSETSRARAGSLAQLAASEPALAIGTRFEPAADSAAHAAIRMALRPRAEHDRFAIVLIGGLPRRGIAAADTAAACATFIALRDELAQFVQEDREAADHRADVGFAALWHAAGEADDAALDRLAALTGEPVRTAGLAGAEDELARLAPRSSAAFLVLAPDQTVLAIHTPEALPADPEQRTAELLMSLLESMARYQAESRQGP